MKIANAPCSWGVLEFELPGETAGYARVLDEMRDTGYGGTELGNWGFMPAKPDILRSALQQRELTLVAAFVPVALANPETHASGELAALQTAALLAAVGGPEALVVLADANGRDSVRRQHAGRIRPEQSLSEKQFGVFASGAQKIAQAVRSEYGLRTVFHHHAAGFVETPAELAQLMALTDPAILGLCLDTGHLAFGGGNPINAVQDYSQRIWHVHLKDLDPDVATCSRAEGWDYFQSIRRGLFCELGRGQVDFAGTLASLNEVGYQGWMVVEQDMLPGMGSPKESARRNRAYLTSIGA